MDRVDLDDSGDARRVFYIDVGDLSPEEAAAKIKEVKTEFSKKRG